MKDFTREIININKILYNEMFGNWISKETLDDLIMLYNLNWEFLWNNSDKKKVINKETLFDRICLIESEIERKELLGLKKKYE